MFYVEYVFNITYLTYLIYAVRKVGVNLYPATMKEFDRGGT